MAESSIKATLWNIYFIYSFEIYTLASMCWCLIAFLNATSAALVCIYKFYFQVHAHAWPMWCSYSYRLYLHPEEGAVPLWRGRPNAGMSEQRKCGWSREDERGRVLRCSDLGSSVWAEVANRQTRPHKKTKLEEQRTAGWDETIAGSALQMLWHTPLWTELEVWEGWINLPFDPFIAKGPKTRLQSSV